jgi:uncharacterized HAD superfamily protein
MDDVLAETARSFLVLVEQEFGKRIPFEAIHSFDLGRSFGLNPQQLDRLMELVHLPDSLVSLAPVPGAVDALRTFADAGFQIAVVTGRPATARDTTRSWLDDNRVPYHHLFFVDKYGRGYPEDGPDSALTLDQLTQHQFSFAVEDSAEMAVFLASRMALPVALLDRPWNRDLPSVGPEAERRIQRFGDWYGVTRRFRAKAPWGDAQ